MPKTTHVVEIGRLFHEPSGSLGASHACAWGSRPKYTPPPPNNVPPPNPIPKNFQLYYTAPMENTDLDDNDQLDVSEYSWNPKVEISIPPDMIEAIAMGLEEPVEIAARFGFAGARWTKLSNWAPFTSTVAAKRAEYAKNGVTFRTKSALKADMLADRVFIEAMQPSTNMSQKMAVLQYLTKVGELEPKEAKTASVGEGFSITINLGGEKTTHSVQDAVDVTPKTPNPANTPQKVTFEDVSGLPPLVDPALMDELVAEMARNRMDD